VSAAKKIEKSRTRWLLLGWGWRWRGRGVLLARRRGHGDGDAVVRFCTYTPPSFQSCFSTAPALLCSALLCSNIPSWSLVRCPSSVEFSPAFGLSSSHLTSYHLVSFLISSRTTSSARYDTSRIHVYLSIYIYPAYQSIHLSIYFGSKAHLKFIVAAAHCTTPSYTKNQPRYRAICFPSRLRCLVASLPCCFVALHCIALCAVFAYMPCRATTCFRHAMSRRRDTHSNRPLSHL
jgi:hypothetical protein